MQLEPLDSAMSEAVPHYLSQSYKLLKSLFGESSLILLVESVEDPIQAGKLVAQSMLALLQPNSLHVLPW